MTPSYFRENHISGLKWMFLSAAGFLRLLLFEADTLEDTEA